MCRVSTATLHSGYGSNRPLDLIVSPFVVVKFGDVLQHDVDRQSTICARCSYMRCRQWENVTFLRICIHSKWGPANNNNNNEKRTSLVGHQFDFHLFAFTGICELLFCACSHGTHSPPPPQIHKHTIRRERIENSVDFQLGSCAARNRHVFFFHVVI